METSVPTDKPYNVASEGNSNKDRPVAHLHLKPLIIAVVTTVLIVMIIIIALVVSFASAHHRSDNSMNRTENLQSSADNFTVSQNTTSRTLRTIRRREWIAQPPVKRGAPLQHPVPYVVVLHTATGNCSTQETCSSVLRESQMFHQKGLEFGDIYSNFYVGGDGYVYEGCGWDIQGGFAFKYNNRSIGITFIGTFLFELPLEKQIQAGLQLIQEGVRLGKISPDYKLLAHRQVSATESPGLVFYETIKSWPHWSEITTN